MSLSRCFAALLLSVAGIASAQEDGALPPAPATAAPSPGPQLTLQEAVQRALARNFTLQIQDYAADNAQQALIAARAAFDPSLQASVNKSASVTPDEGSFLDEDLNPIIITGTRSDAVRSRFGVSQRLSTGAVVSATGSLDRRHAIPSRSRINPAYDSDISLAISQPLLRGFGPAYNRGIIEQAEIDVRRAEHDFKGAVLDVIRNVEIAFYSLGFAREQLGLRRFSLAVAEQLLEENRARRDTGVSTDLDVLQAEVGVANARRTVLLGEQDVADATDQLLQLIGQFEFNDAVGDVRIGEVQPPPVSFDHSYRLARENQPAYAAQLALIEQLRIETHLARRDRLPDLAVDGAVGYNAREPNARAAATELWEGDGYAWQLGLSVNVPWGSRADRARYRQAMNNLAREETRLQSIDQSILVQVRSAVRSVETNAAGVRISRLATQLSERQFELEKARFDAGLSTFRRVQESQADLDTARVNELQARVALRTALAELARLEGTSLERFRIAVRQDG